MRTHTLTHAHTRVYLNSGIFPGCYNAVIVTHLFYDIKKKTPFIWLLPVLEMSPGPCRHFILKCQNKCSSPPHCSG